MSRVIRLFKMRYTGELVVAEVPKQKEGNIVTFYNPLKYVGTNETTIYFKEWIPYSEEAVIPVQISDILLSCVPTSDMINSYEAVRDCIQESAAEVTLNQIFDGYVKENELKEDDPWLSSFKTIEPPSTDDEEEFLYGEDDEEEDYF